MFNIVKTRSTHSQKLERWLGAEQVRNMSAQMRGWYGAPIAVGRVPGLVYATGDGDFVGPIRAGQFGSIIDVQFERLRAFTKQMSIESRLVHGVGFASLSDMISKWTQDNKGQQLWFMKSETANSVSGRSASPWYKNGVPGVGVSAGAAPGGTVHAKGDAGSYPVINTVTGSNSLHVVSGFSTNASSSGTYILYDRLFSVAKTMSSTASEAVTGVPSRYQSTTSSDWDYIGSNFIFPEVTATLSATAHNWDSIQYTDQDGNAGTCPSTAGVSSGAVDVVDLPANTWYMPLASGDIGVKALTSIKCSASVTGGVTWVLGRPLVLMPVWTQNVMTPQDFTNSSFGVPRMYDTACLALLWMAQQGTTCQPTVNVNLLAT